MKIAYLRADSYKKPEPVNNHRICGSYDFRGLEVLGEDIGPAGYVDLVLELCDRTGISPLMFRGNKPHHGNLDERSCFGESTFTTELRSESGFIALKLMNDKGPLVTHVNTCCYPGVKTLVDSVLGMSRPHYVQIYGSDGRANDVLFGIIHGKKIEPGIVDGFSTGVSTPGRLLLLETLGLEFSKLDYIEAAGLLGKDIHAHWLSDSDVWSITPEIPWKMAKEDLIELNDENLFHHYVPE